MPIFLPVAEMAPGGPDGKGMNRISLGSLAGDQCALRPLDYSHYIESQDTRRARYGGYGSCVRDGQCDGCPVLTVHAHLDALIDRVLVRIGQDGRPYLMNRPEDGWASNARRWTWERLSRLADWYPGARHVDEHGNGFWLERAS